MKLADGRKATNAGGRPPSLELAADAISLTRTHGHSNDRSATLDYFLAPAPPAGPLTLVLAWPAFGIEECTLEIGTDELPLPPRGR